MRKVATKVRLRTPVAYYGGKQMMLKHILPLIPKHEIYTESFVGGAAVDFAKASSRVEIINDLNGEVVNFYQQLKTNFNNLKLRLEATLHSRQLYKDAQVMYDNPHLFNNEARAWAFWVLTNQGFASTIGSWGYSKTRPTRGMNKKLLITKELEQRLGNTQIECNDANKVILSRDTPNTFHYIDPPYIDSNQGHYAGYVEMDFKELLNTLSMVQGKFLLSTYPSGILSEYAKSNGWHQKEFDKPISANKTTRKRKVEVLTANYPI